MSILFNAMTMFLTPISNISIVKKRFLIRQEASTTFTITSAFPFRMKFLAMSSSTEFAVREYVPGRSTTRNSLSRYFIMPSFFSTVTPGQLPTCCLKPVKALNIVVFPTFGLPASATTFRPSFFSSGTFSTLQQELIKAPS